MSELPVQYFMKELVSNPFWLSNGTKVKFEDIGGDTGVIATADPGLILQLANAAHAHKGGIIPISQDRYAELKKNVNSSASDKSSRNQPSIRAQPQTLWIQEAPELARSAKAAAAAAAPAAKVEPVNAAPVDPPLKKVRRGRPKSKPDDNAQRA